MDAFTYIVISEAAIALLYIAYKLLWAGDTFLHWHRAVVMCGIAFALVLPFATLLPHLPAATIGGMEPLATRMATLPAIAIGGAESDGISVGRALLIIYCTGVLVGLCLLAVKLISLATLHLRCHEAIIDGTPVYVMSTGRMPFSFAGNIYVPAALIGEEMLHTIIAHEKVHVSQHHTMDIIVGELLVVTGWFNPCAWLLRHEIETYTELIADSCAVKEAPSRKAYQYDLLQVSVGGGIPIGMAFGRLSLKQRIAWINRTSSRHIRKMSYLVAIPLALALLVGAYACKDNTAREAITPAPTPVEQPAEHTMETPAEEAPIYDSCEVMPQYPGGIQALMSFVSTHLEYPAKAKEQKIEGNVIVRFVVDREGRVTNPEIVRGLTPECDAEVLRMVQLIPRWTPGTEKGTPVNVSFTLPIQFRLQ